MESVNIILKQFESFIKRAVVPSISFVFIFLVVGVVFIYFGSIEYKEIYLFDILIELFNFDNIFLLTILLIGLSFFLSILTQTFYDNFLKGNFDYFFIKNELLKKYKKLVASEIVKQDIFKDFDKEKFTDYELYQIVGRDTDTKRYIDDIKSIGIFFISLVISIFIWSLLCNFYYGFFISIIFYIIGFFIIIAKYRARAIRIYINYLLEKKGENGI